MSATVQMPYIWQYAKTPKYKLVSALPGKFLALPLAFSLMQLILLQPLCTCLTLSARNIVHLDIINKMTVGVTVNSNVI